MWCAGERRDTRGEGGKVKVSEDETELCEQC